ncbi:MAG: hypothetical protein JSU72_12445 [Deltaproteobacteria bacterium]|nr:MAG: hypothetical protein JSU72_12445 [Deltaproteobacteria bacterium]
MTEQLSLFGEENTLFNAGVKQLLDMDFDGGLQTLERYGKLFPWGREVRTEVEIATFWKSKLDQVVWTPIDPMEAERLYRIWVEFERTFNYPWREDSIEEQLRVVFFSKLANGLEAGGYSTLTKLTGGTPVGLIYLMARRLDVAINSLQTLIAADPENPKAYGYLGDTYRLRGDARTARLCYREAFVIAPGRVDLARLQDDELKERLDELGEDEDQQGDFLEWFPVRAQLEGIFERRVFRDLDDLKHWLQGYLDLVKAYKKTKDPAFVPRLFYHAMVLSDNAPMMRFIKKVDLSEIRRKMKEWHPGLFARHIMTLDATTVK